MFFVFRCYLLPLGVVTLYVLNVPKRQCKITTFPQTSKGMDDFSIFTETQQPCHPCAGCAGAWDLWLRLVFFPSFSLERKGTKVQGRLHRTSPRLSKHLTLRSRSTFCEGKRQAPLREGQALSHPLRALPRPTRSVFGEPLLEALLPLHFIHALYPHGGQGSAISYALETHSCRRFASSRGGTTKRSI